MPPKKKNQTNKQADDENLQAIVMSDSYQDRFMPLTLETPRCLLPLANTPLIEYTLEFLATAGVHEIYVVGSAHVEKIEEYLAQSKWSLPHSPFKVLQVIKSTESQSVGDAMRDLDRMGLITSDFLLISGDIVSNLDFKQVLRAHRERKAKDKNSIMTMVLREASAFHRTRARSGAGLFVIDEPTGQCLRYESAPNVDHLDSFDIDYEVLSQHNTISLRNDLIDCHIDICGPDIPALFTENFDYNDIRTDFVKGIVTSELLGKTIYTHIIDKQYSARVESYQTYDAVSKDIISRYSYPITPEYNLLDGQSYQYQHGHIYKEDNVVLSQSCIVRKQTIIGKETYIGEKATVTKSIIGRRCKVGKNTVIENSYIWDDVVIEDDVVIKQSIIASGSTIKKGARVESGSVISFNVKIGSNKTIKDTKITLQKPKNDDGFSDDETDEEEDEVDDSEVVGKDGIGYVYVDSFDSDGQYDSDSDEEAGAYAKSMHSLVYKMSEANLSDSSIVSETGKHRGSRASHKGHKRQTSVNGTTYTDVEEDDGDDDEEESFKSEAIASIARSITENHDVDIAALELNTLRMTMNVPYHEVREATIAAFVSYISKLVSTDTLGVVAATKKIFNNWGDLFKRQAFDGDDQVDLLLLLQNECTDVPQGKAIMMTAVESLYDNDHVEEDNIYSWFDSDESQASESLRSIRGFLATFVEWLKTADSESEESD